MVSTPNAVLLGIAIGVSTVAAPLYISEISPPKSRGRLAGMFQFNIVFGILIAFLYEWRTAVISLTAIPLSIALEATLSFLGVGAVEPAHCDAERGRVGLRLAAVDRALAAWDYPAGGPGQRDAHRLVRLAAPVLFGLGVYELLSIGLPVATWRMAPFFVLVGGVAVVSLLALRADGVGYDDLGALIQRMQALGYADAPTGSTR